VWGRLALVASAADYAMETARLYALITVATPARPTWLWLAETGRSPFGLRLPGPFAAVCATGSHFARLSEALATGTRPVHGLSCIRLYLTSIRTLLTFVNVALLRAGRRDIVPG